MLRPHKSSPSTHQANSPPTQQRLDYGASGTSKSIGCSHHHRWGTAPLCCSPCLHSCRIGLVATYTAIVCQRICIYSAILFIPHSLNMSSDFGYTHSFQGPCRSLCFCAMRHAALIWNPSSRVMACGEIIYILLLYSRMAWTIAR
jgi:hypothetical protein